MHLRLIKGLSYDGVVRASATHPDVFVDDPEKYTALLESGYFEALPDAHTVTGHLVAQCTARGKTLEELTLEELKAVSPLFEQDVYDALNLENCMALRSSYGGPAVAETARQIGEIEQFIQKIKENR